MNQLVIDSSVLTIAILITCLICMWMLRKSEKVYKGGSYALVFSNLVFLFIFLPIVLAIYYISPRKLKNFILLMASLIFYAWGEPTYVFLMLFSIAINYIFGLMVAIWTKSLSLTVIVGIVTMAIIRFIFGS